MYLKVLFFSFVVAILGEQTNELRVLEQKCKEYSELVYENVTNGDGDSIKTDNCAFKATPLINSESNPSPGDFPHVVRLGYGSSLDTILWTCTGSIISRRYILTVAHCVRSRQPGSPTYVLVGDVDIKMKVDGELPQTIQVESVVVHPESEDTTFYNDIALLKLVKDIEFNAFVRPACLNTNFEITDPKAVATGWDWTDFLGPKRTSLQKGNLSILSTAECNSYHKQSRKLPKGFLESQQLCAVVKDGEDGKFCADSGTPLQVYHELSCMYSIVGIASFGRGCAKVPDVFVRVSSYVDWIEENAFSHG